MSPARQNMELLELEPELFRSAPFQRPSNDIAIGLSHQLRVFGVYGRFLPRAHLFGRSCPIKLSIS